MYANFFQTTPDSLTSFKCGHLQKNIYIYIYKYIFRSNLRGLAPLGPARPDKFINLATLGPSALASRGIIIIIIIIINKNNNNNNNTIKRDLLKHITAKTNNNIRHLGVMMTPFSRELCKRSCKLHHLKHGVRKLHKYFCTKL